MKKLGLMAFLLTIGSFSTVGIANIPLPEGHRVRGIVSDVLKHYKTYGAEATFEKVNMGWTQDGEYYAFVNRVSDSTIVAHAANPKMVGKTASGVVNSEGRHIVREIIDMATGLGAWIEYKWIHPLTGEERDKRSWIIRIDDYVIGSGYYL